LHPFNEFIVKYVHACVCVPEQCLWDQRRRNPEAGVKAVGSCLMWALDYRLVPWAWLVRMYFFFFFEDLFLFSEIFLFFKNFFLYIFILFYVCYKLSCMYCACLMPTEAKQRVLGSLELSYR
jgi:hypothetical protein